MSHSNSSLWRPSAELNVIRLRAAMNRQIRDFFFRRDVLEVETPVLSQAGTSDPFIDSFSLNSDTQKYYLHTSPELPMKRLLAAQSGAIFQIAKVFRDGELGAKHNPEFSLLEWYRPGFDLTQLMHEVGELVAELLTRQADKPNQLSEPQPIEFISYQGCFEKILHINPHRTHKAELFTVAEKHNLHQVLDRDDEIDRWLDLLMSHIIEPYLGGSREQPSLCFVYDYPATQAALARIENNASGQPVAKRFELYIAGMELANGFYELADAKVQRERFEADNRHRIQMGKSPIPIDEHFIQALQAGLPDCSGVALGLDRLLMLLTGKQSIAEVLCFPISNA